MIKSEERLAQDKIRLYELDPSQGIALKLRQHTNKMNDVDIKKLVLEFDKIHNPIEQMSGYKCCCAIVSSQMSGHKCRCVIVSAQMLGMQVLLRNC